MNTLDIAVLPGDGIGVDVTDAALTVLRQVAGRHNLGLRFTKLRAGAFAYRDTGEALSEEVFERAAQADAILLGAMGWPGIRRPDGTELAPQLDLRMRLGLYAGVRPIRAIPGIPRVLADPRADGIDFVIVRESTEGLFYSCERGEVTQDWARETLQITRATTEKLARFSFNLARQRAADPARPRGDASAGQPAKPGAGVTLVDKANVFRAFAYMRAIFAEIATDYPDVPNHAHYVDAMALDLLRRPWDFDVLPTENMFGDILSDLAAGLIGGMGFAPSADMGDTHAVFQPSHGTAPDIAGKGIANPTATILCAAMMLEWLGTRGAGQACQDAAQELRAAVDQIFLAGLRTPDIGGGAGTADVVRAVLAALPSST